MLSRLFRRVRVPAAAGRPAHFRLRRARPTLVELEDRSVPTTFTWQGATGSDWNLGTNWDQGTAPNIGADVVINNGTTPAYNTTTVEIHTLTVGSTSGLSVNGGTLTLDSASTVGGALSIIAGGMLTANAALHITGSLTEGGDAATLNGTGDVTIDGLFTSDGCIMSGSGTTVANGGILYERFTFTLKDGRHLDNEGTATVTGGGFNFQNGGVFDNNGTFDIQVDSSMGVGFPAGADSAFNNNGTFKKTAGSGAASILVPFNNHGIAEGQNGTVDVQVGTLLFRGGVTSTGPWTVAAPAILDFADGTWNLNAGSTVSGAGIGRFEFAVVNLSDTYTLDHTEFTFDGIVNFNANSSTKTLDLNAGTLGGSGDFTVADSLTWGSGRMTGAGTTFVNGALTLNLFFSPGLNGRRLDNNGTATWIRGGFELSNGAVFNNNGTFDDQIDTSITNGSGAQSLFNNNGTFRKSVLGGTTNILTAFTNNDAIDVQTGTVSLNGPSGGLTNFPIASAAAIEPTGATESGTTVTITTSGHQFLVVGQTVTISGMAEPGYNGTFTVTAVPSQLKFQYTAATSGLPDSGGGTATFLSTSTLTGGTYLISGTFQFTGANIVTNAANIVLNGPTAAFLNEFPVTDALANLATNAAAGKFTIQNGRNFTAAGGFNNAGNVVVGGGSQFTLSAGNYTQTAGATTVNGTLAVGLVDLSGGVLSGVGTVAANLTNAALVAPGQPVGSLHVTGDYTQTAAGTLSFELAGTNAADFDRLGVDGAATLDGTVAVALANGFHPAVGDSFPVLSFGSRTGDFSTHNGFALGNALFLGEQFGTTALTLVTNKASLQYQTQPADTPAGQSFTVAVRVVDAGGNLLTFDSADQVTLTLNQNSFAGGATSVTQPVVNGVASFTLTINQGATGYRLTAGGNGFAGVLSNVFTIQQPATIGATGQATFTVGTAGSVLVTAGGFPTPTLTVNPQPPAGVTFMDNGNGTATLAGTPDPNTGGIYTLAITAHNGVGADATQTFTLTVNQAPAVTSPNASTFTVGAAGSFTVTTTGFPVSVITESGALPPGVTLTDNHDGTATLGGTPAAGTGGTFTLTITAANGVGANATQPFTLTVHEAPAITTASQTVFVESGSNLFTVKASGFPKPTLSLTGTLPPGVSFTDLGGGTARLSGSPAPGTSATYAVTITASNGVGGAATQTFTLTVVQTPQAPTIAGDDHATFTAGVAGSFDVLTTGAPTPGITASATPPPGLTFTDHGDGTATLAGTPAPGTGGTYSFTLTAANGIDPDATQAFTLTVNEAPAVTATGAPAFAVGTAGSISVHATGFPIPTLTLTGSLPDGVTFDDHGDGTGELHGTPVADAGGAYVVTITASNGVGVVTLTFTLVVNEPPAVGGGNVATFTVGAAGAFPVAATGFPVPVLSVSGTPPAGLTFTDHGDGTGTLAGTPAAGGGGVYSLTIVAANGAGTNSTLVVTVTVTEAPSITSGSSATFRVGTAGSFPVTTGHAFPAATTLRASGLLPLGVTFVDRGDGTGALTGTPAAGTGGRFTITITASNGVAPDAAQSFTLTVTEPPSITSAGGATFLVGAAGSFTVTTGHGFPAPASISLAGTPPAGLTFTDRGDGTATLAGTPAAGTGGVYRFTITAHNGTGADAAQSFTLTVNQPPALTGAGAATFTVGSPAAFTVTATGFPSPTLTEAGGLPAGVTFADNGDGTATLAGTAGAGTGGVYAFTVTARNGAGNDATRAFTLTVNQAPAVTSGSTATFTVGSAAAFPITATGFPVPALTMTGSLPAGVTFTDHGDGTATLGGVPAAGAGGTYTVTVTAATGVGGAAAQTFTLTVDEAPAFTSGPPPATVTAGAPLSLRLTATGNPAPTFALLSGQLPTGLTLDPVTGAITGTPTAPGTFTGTLRAASPAGFADQPFAVTVTAAGGRPGGDRTGISQLVISGGASVIPLNPDGSPFGAPVTPFGTVGTRAVLADVTGDGVPDLVVGSGPGTAARVVVIDGATRRTVTTLTPFEDAFTGGTFVAAGDVDGDGRADVAVSADTTGGPRVVVFGGATGAVLADFFGIEDPNFRGGARVAVGDVNHDGLADLAVSAGAGGGPRVALFDGASVRPGKTPTHLVGDFFAFEPALRDGVYVAIGDVSGDGYGDVVAGAGSGGSPRVLVVSGRGLLAAGGAAVESPVANFFAEDPARRDGARVAAKDLDGDHFADLVVAVPAADGRRVVGFRGAELAARGGAPAFEDFSAAFDPLLSGVFIG